MFSIRYAVLWLYGGVYIDDDSDIRTPLDKVVEPLDSLIISSERNGYNGDGCFVPRYHLSDAYTLKTYANHHNNASSSSSTATSTTASTGIASQSPLNVLLGRVSILYHVFSNLVPKRSLAYFIDR